MQSLAAYVWLAVNGVICWGLLLRSYDRNRRDLVPFTLFCGFLPAFVMFAAGAQILLR